MIGIIINSALIVFLIISLIYDIRNIKLYKEILANQAILINHKNDTETLIKENTAAQRERTQATRQLLAKMQQYENDL